MSMGISFMYNGAKYYFYVQYEDEMTLIESFKIDGKLLIELINDIEEIDSV
jgi:hypothetical protein